MAGRYDNPIPTRCLAPIDFLKIPALVHLLSVASLPMLVTGAVTYTPAVPSVTAAVGCP